MKDKTSDLMRAYLNDSSMLQLCRGHCESLRKSLDLDLTSILLNYKEYTLAFVIPEDCRRLFQERLLDAFFEITKIENAKMNKSLEKVKKHLKAKEKEFSIL